MLEMTSDATRQQRENETHVQGDRLARTANFLHDVDHGISEKTTTADLVPMRALDKARRLSPFAVDREVSMANSSEPLLFSPSASPKSDNAESAQGGAVAVAVALSICPYCSVPAPLWF
jgi:hypothetical protein